MGASLASTALNSRPLHHLLWRTGTGNSNSNVHFSDAATRANKTLNRDMRRILFTLRSLILRKYAFESLKTKN